MSSRTLTTVLLLAGLQYAAVPALAATPSPTPSPTDSASPSASPSPSPSPSPSASPASGQPVTGYGPGTLTAMTLPVNDSGRSSRQVWVWLPPGVSDSPTLPVVYLLHGQNESPRTPFANGIAAALSDAFATGLPPFELVVPDGISAVRTDDEWADAADSADSLETFVGSATVSAVEGSNPRPRSLRAIAGFSMGGYGASVMAARQSGLFGQLVSLAGYYHVDDPEHALGSNGTYRYVHTPLSRADQYGHTRVLLLDCSADATAPVFAGDLTRMHDALAAQGHAPGAHISSGSHSWGWANTQMQSVVTFLAQGWGRG